MAGRRYDILVMEKEATLYGAAIRASFPDAVVHEAVDADAALAAASGPAAHASALVALAHEIPAELIARLPALRWVQALTTGTDHLTGLPNLPADLVVTSGRGIHGPQMAEMAFLYMIALSRDFRGMMANQAARRWERWPQKLLLSKTALLLGVGTISEAVAQRCQAFGMRTVGISSGRTRAPGFDAVHPRADLVRLAGEADFVIVLVPLTAETHHLVGRDVLAAMKPGAILINLARGSVVDEAALVEALQAGRIAGAGLDVFETEPPLPENPLWRLDNVIMTPRVGGMSDVYAQQVLPLLLENVGHFRAGDLARMRNLVS